MISSDIAILAIEYDQPQGSVFVGEVISGRVIIQLHQALSVRGIRIYFNGTGKTCWSSWSKFNSSREVYLSEAQELLQSRNNPYNALLHLPGIYNYPFSFRLPTDLPASYQDASNYIRYKSKATVEGQWGVQKFTTEKLFYVFRHLDLNLEPSRFKRDIRILKEVYHSSGCCVSGIVKVDFTVNRQCFVPLENVVLSGVIENSTGRTIRRTSIAIVQRVTVHKSLLKRVLKTTLSRVDGPEVPPYQEMEWNDIKLLIPQVPLSLLEHCSIMDIDYSIKFTAAFQLPWVKSTRTLKTIVIGDVPLQSQADQRLITAPSLDSSSPQSDVGDQRSPRSRTSWGTQWNMVSWMNPLERHEANDASSSPSYDRESNVDVKAIVHQRTADASGPLQPIQEFPENRSNRDSDILLNDFA